MKTTIKVQGMHCHACEALITDVLTDLEGVQEAKVNLQAGAAVVTHDATVTEQQLRKAIETEGYKTN